MNRGIFKGWDNSGRSTGGNPFSGFGKQGSLTSKRPTRDALVYYPIANPVLVGTSNPKAFTADQTVALTNDMSGKGGVGPGDNQFPIDGSAVAMSITIAFSETSTGTPSIFIYNFDGANVDIGATHSESWRVYTGKVASHGASLNIPLVYTGGLNNAQVKYSVDWAAGTANAYMYCTGYWVRA